MSFENLNLHPKILKAITSAGYIEPTTVQLKVIPKVLRGFDIRTSAQTGTGKTAAFLLPALNRLATPAPKTGPGPRILILVPTRELAMQITTQAEKYSKYLHHIKTVCIVGGVPYHPQERKLSRPYDILIATPGRLIDFINQRKIKLSRLEMMVLDEADRMLDMGFVQPVEQIVEKTPSSRQTLMFSATLHGSVIKLSEKLLNKPMEITVQPELKKSDNIKQTLHYTDNLSHKNRLLDHILKQNGVDYAIVFTSTKRYAAQLVGDLRDKNYRAAALHGDMNQNQRTRTITQLRNGKIKILVATDVASRGIDVLSITHVINFDLPQSVEDYVHRIGRTGRAGATGTALSFASGQDAYLVRKIEEFTGQKIDIKEITGLEPRTKTSPSSSRSHKKPNSFPRSARNRRFRKTSKSKPQQGQSYRPRKAGSAANKPSRRR